MWHDLAVALALLLVLEGILPFLKPDTLRKALLKMTEMEDSKLRFGGLTSMLAGVLLLYFVNM